MAVPEILSRASERQMDFTYLEVAKDTEERLRKQNGQVKGYQPNPGPSGHPYKHGKVAQDNQPH